MGDIESDNIEYDITKEKVKNLAKEIAVVRKKATETKGKGKRNLILSESEDEEELLATVVDIIEDTVANKVLVKTQFKIFVKVRALQGWPKKVKSTNTSTAENIVDLVSTPPPPSPTQITQE